jgi:outer membrane protein TolC
MLKSIFLFFLFFILLFPGIRAGDTVRILTENDFIAAVRQYHPVAKQAGLLMDAARARLLSARGAFDPVFQYQNDQKTFDSKNYFNYVRTEMVLPTWYGIEGYVGLERNNGVFTNDELTIGKSSFAGIRLPLIKDLVLDTRRASLQQAKFFLRQSESEQRLVVNDLLRDASFSYWNWVRDYQLLQNFNEVIRVNEQRYELIKISYQQGDRAPIDTTEALAQLQNFQQMKAEAILKLQKSALELSTFLWMPDEQPAYLKETTLPDTAAFMKIAAFTAAASLDQWMKDVLSLHPKLQMLDWKIAGLEVERKLKFQSLLPKADLKYNFLQSGYQPWKGIGANLFENNFKYGLSILMPIPNRSGWGDYRSARVKVQAVQLEQDFTRLSLENKLRYHYSEVQNLQDQVRIYESAFGNYQRLLDAEKLRFSLGETTLFILNARENRVLETLQKLLDLKAKSYQSIVSLNWAAGQLR